LAISFAARTDIGRKRKTNEDFFAVDEARQIYVVADGLGGHVAGRTASEAASFRFCTAMREFASQPPLDALRMAFREAHRAIEERVAREPELAGMGTTLVALWLRGSEAVIGHAGDSRIYLLRAGALYPLTHDHSLVSEMVFRGQLTPERARTHPHRHFITRALGVSGAPEPDTARFGLQPGDTFVLCSDGISSTIDDDEIQEQLDEAKGDLGQAAEGLIVLANERGGEDNATVVLVSFA
jgi:protein phosphatase